MDGYDGHSGGSGAAGWDPHYRALALRSRCDAVDALAPEDAREAIGRAITRIRAETAASIALIGPDVRPVVLPEYVLDKYLDVYGIDGVLPVARTPLGNLAALASEEILYPEPARALTLRGAEVLCHSTSEAGSPRPTPKSVARIARAVENHAYVVSANTAGITGTAIPGGSTDGMSQVVDFTGTVLVEAGVGESMVANAELDLAALRRTRRRPGMGNLLARGKPALWAGEYARATGETPNGLMSEGTASNGAAEGAADGEAAAKPPDYTVPDRAWFARRQPETLERLIKAGVIT
ncbi:nitrilase-related carbon-nitrogen hydrolase [Yinghuangia seranimata]|uniref:nitrilase-related carbon-nitrogen hydrolase n=1 Tax=Yinghuangia seranimata TaxID=408067 RepID=UPI00248B8A81|nr:nitrilase-related carbon-nitrogen hydrolase [Yinghuangia seranimata]MDI2131878.1 nitrilase-related carbon-nitrogen hydrolase [Yinghuangia seranimata]